MSSQHPALADWTPEQIAHGKRWVQAWRQAGPFMEELRRKELRELVGLKAIGLLCCPADYTIPPRAPKPSSGLVEQQYCSQKRGNVIEVIRAAAACKGCANASNGNFASSEGSPVPSEFLVRL